MTGSVGDRDRRRGFSKWLSLVVGAVVLYVLSSGPVLALAFVLREWTDWDGFYAVMWVYYPLLIWGHQNFVMDYIEWWVELCGTVGPG